jgi:hypothetical protein
VIPASEQPLTVTNADLVDRLVRLRTILPLMAKELAIARRHATELAAENRRLTQRLLDLESRLTHAPQQPHAAGNGLDNARITRSQRTAPTRS